MLYPITRLERASIVSNSPSSASVKIWNWLVAVQTLLFKPWLLFLLGLAVLIAITITGSLGGALVYGPEIDPVVSFIYHLFFKI